MERVVEVTAPPVVIVVTATPANSGQGSVVGGQQQPQAAPAQVAPVRQTAPQAIPQAQPTPMPTPRPRVQPTALPPTVGGPVRAAGVQAQPTPGAGPQERLLSRPCEYRRTQYPQGTIIRGYYTDAQGVQRDAVCRLDGWKAVN